MHHPEIAEKWTKEHGSKPVGKKKKKSVLECIRKIVAEDINVQQPAQPGQTQQAPVQQTPVDLNSATTMIPQVVKQLNTRNMQLVRQELVNKYKVPEDVAYQATMNFGAKILREEMQKRQQTILNEVAQAMGLSPMDLSKSYKPAPLPGTQGSTNRRLKLASIVESNFQKKANQIEHAIEQASNKSLLDKAKELYKFILSVGPEEAAQRLVNFADNILSTLPKKSTASRTSAAMGGRTAMLGVLWLLSLMAVGSVITDQMANAVENYGVIKGFWQAHPDKAEQAHNFALAVKMIGVAGLATIFSAFMKKKQS